MARVALLASLLLVACGGEGLAGPAGSVLFAAPEEGATVGGRALVRLAVGPVDGLSELSVELDGAPLHRFVAPVPAEPAFSLDTRERADGVIELRAVARWEDGDESEALLVLRADNTSPRLTVLAPADGAPRYLEDGPFTFEARAEDDSTLAYGELRAGGMTVAAFDPPPSNTLAVEVDPDALVPPGATGPVTLPLEAEVVDGAGARALVGVEVRLSSRLAFTFIASGSILTAPALLADGAIAIGTSRGWLHVIEPDGSERCHANAIDEPVESGPVPSADGSAVAWGTTRRLRLTSTEDCALLFESGAVAEWTGGPAVGPSGNVYATTFAGVTEAFAPDGTIRWSTDLAPLVPAAGGPPEALSGIALTADGAVVQGLKVGLTGGAIVALEAATGRVRWAVDMPAVRGGLLAVGPLLYAGGGDGRLYALRLADGSRAWVREPEVGAGIQCAPARLDDGGIAVCDRTGVVAVFEPESGAERFRVALEVGGRPTGITEGGMTVAPDGALLVGDSLGVLHALGPDGALRWSFRTPSEEIRERPAAGFGMVYVGSANDRLYALRSR